MEAYINLFCGIYNIWIIINESPQVVYRIISGKEIEYYFTNICTVISF